MKVSLNGISNQCFFDRFFEKRIYCKSKSNWFLRLFERPLQIHMERAPIEINYSAELNGLELGVLENFDDGIIFNLYAPDSTDLYLDAQHFLAASRGHSYTLSIYDTDRRPICDYSGATSTMIHVKTPSYRVDTITGVGLTHYKLIHFNWEYKSDGAEPQRIRNPLNTFEQRLTSAQADVERSQRALREALELNASLLKVAHEKMDYPFPLDMTARAPENPTPLPPTRDIKICKG